MIENSFNQPAALSDTIVALCTAQAKGALALIRISGPQAWQIGAFFIRLTSKKQLCDITSHTVHAADIYDEQTLIDTVMVIALRGPKTFTGYDTLEITCHNNLFIIQSVIELAIKHGARPAQQGEFSRQAYENKKIDLLQAEAINELIGAQTQAALKKSLSQLEGSLSAQITKLEDMLCQALAWCQASFEFLEDEGDFYDELDLFLGTIVDTIKPLIAGYTCQKQIRQGYRVALIGSVNAGKSSLFNLLSGHKRAIVTPIAGTTRDSIENTLFLDDITITLIDTAGLRITDDRIEKEGIERSYQEAHSSDIILLVIDDSRLNSCQEYAIYDDLYKRYPEKIILIHNKADLPSCFNPLPDNTTGDTSRRASPLKISAFLEDSKKIVYEAIKNKISLLSDHHDLPFLVNKRHHDLLQALFKDISLIHAMLKNSAGNPGRGSTHYELIFHDLKEALAHISELTGKTVSEQALDRVFKEFCVGK